MSHNEDSLFVRPVRYLGCRGNNGHPLGEVTSLLGRIIALRLFKGMMHLSHASLLIWLVFASGLQ